MAELLLSGGFWSSFLREPALLQRLLLEGCQHLGCLRMIEHNIGQLALQPLEALAHLGLHQTCIVSCARELQVARRRGQD